MTDRETTPIDLYLSLLKKSLTDTLFSGEPEMDDSPRSVRGFIEHYMKGTAVTLLPMVRLDNLQTCVVDVIKRRVPGDLIETGVWRGGATIFMRAILKAYGVSDRRVWAADSFEGLPMPDPEAFPLEARARNGVVIKNHYNGFAVDLETVKKNFAAYGLLDESVVFLKGWFKDSLPTAPIGRLAIIRLDGDYYESTMDGLRNLYDKLSVGGYIIIDDYGEDEWTYCRRAVDEFRGSRGITESLIRVDSKCYFWQRTS